MKIKAALDGRNSLICMRDTLILNGGMMIDDDMREAMKPKYSRSSIDNGLGAMKREGWIQRVGKIIRLTRKFKDSETRHISY